jgi:hypothetical protein
MLDLTILNSYIFLSSCGVRNFAYGFSDNPTGEYVGTGWTRKKAAKAKTEHLLRVLKLLDLKTIADNIGLFCLPRKDVMYVRPGVSPEMFQ